MRDKDAKKKKILELGEIAGSMAFDPVLRRLAETVNNAIPRDSALRSETTERIISGIKQWAEGAAKELPPPFDWIAEKATDFGDFLSTLLREGRKDGRAKQSASAVNDWMAKFFDDAREKLKTSADPTGRKVSGMLNNCAGGETPWHRLPPA